MKDGNVKRIFLSESTDIIPADMSDGEFHIIGKYLISVKAAARINKHLVIRIKLPQQISADNVIVEYRSRQFIFFQKFNFLNRHVTVKIPSEPFIVRPVFYVKKRNHAEKENENHDRKDRRLAAEFGHLQTGNQQIIKDKEKDNREKIGCPTCFHAFPIQSQTDDA